MASADRVACQESILLPVLIVALGGALAGGSYGLAMTSNALFLILPLFGGLTMGMAMSLSLTFLGVALRPTYSLLLLIIWSLGSGTFFLVFPVLQRLMGQQAILIQLFFPVIAGGLTGWATKQTIQRMIKVRLDGVTWSAIWTVGFGAFFISYFWFLALIAATLMDILVAIGRIEIPFLLAGLMDGGLSAGISGWLMFRELQSALRRRSHMKSRKIHVARANVESSQPSAEG